jgi:hypothetical protein
MQNFDHNIGFWEKRQFFRRKLSKIAENCDHNIDPMVTRLGEFSPMGRSFNLGTFLQNLGYFSHSKSYVLIFKYGLVFNLGYFFKNASGHPGIGRNHLTNYRLQFRNYVCKESKTFSSWHKIVRRLICFAFYVHRF